MKKYKDVLCIPISRIIALLLMDVLSVSAASFMAIYLRYDFKYSQIPSEYLDIYVRTILFTLIITLLFFFHLEII